MMIARVQVSSTKNIFLARMIIPYGHSLIRAQIEKISDLIEQTPNGRTKYINGYNG